MKRTLISSALALCCGFSQAHDDSSQNMRFDNDACDLNLNGNIQLTENQIVVRLDNHSEMLIDDNYYLYIDGEQIELDDQQSQWTQDYHQGFYSAVPQVANLATEAVSLAGTAVSEVFVELLDDPAFADDLLFKLDELNQQVQTRFYAEDGSIHLDSTHFDDGDFIDDAWAEEMETMIEEYVMSSLGRIMITLGTQMLTGDGGDFEQRIESMAMDIESKVEGQAQLIEQKANQLCLTLVKVDEAENNLQRTIPALAELDMLEVTDHLHRM